MAYATAHKYKKLALLPSEVQSSSEPRLNVLFQDEWEELVVPLLIENPRMTAYGIRDHLIQIDPEKYQSNMLRTLQRRLSAWRKLPVEIKKAASLAPNKPGGLCLSGLIRPPVKITIRGVVLPHQMFFVFFPGWKWIFLAPIMDRNSLNLLGLLEEALTLSGISPDYHFHRRQNKSKSNPSGDFTESRNYNAFVKHLSIVPIEKEGAFPPEWRKMSAFATSEFKKGFTINNFNAIPEYESSVRSLVTELNKEWLPILAKAIKDKKAQPFVSEIGFAQDLLMKQKHKFRLYSNSTRQTK